MSIHNPSRAVAFFLTLALFLPNPAFALRQTGLEESDPTKRDLTDALRSGDPDAGLEEPPLSFEPGAESFEDAVLGGVRRFQGRWVYFVLSVPDSPAASSAVPAWLERIAAAGARVGRQSPVVLLTRPSNHEAVRTALSKARLEWPWVRLVGARIHASSQEADDTRQARRDMAVALDVIRAELAYVHTDTLSTGEKVDKTVNFRVGDHDFMRLLTDQIPPPAEFLLAALGALGGAPAAEVRQEGRLLATMLRGDQAENLRIEKTGPAPKEIQIAAPGQGAAPQQDGAQAGLAVLPGYENYTLPPPDGIERVFGSNEEFVAFVALKIKTGYEALLKSGSGRRHFRVLIKGTGGSGKTTLVRGMAAAGGAPAIKGLRDLLHAEGIPTVSVDQDWWTATAKARDDLRDSGRPEDLADYADARRTWDRWPALRAVFKVIGNAAGSVTLRELYHYCPNVWRSN